MDDPDPLTAIAVIRRGKTAADPSMRSVPYYTQIKIFCQPQKPIVFCRKKEYNTFCNRCFEILSALFAADQRFRNSQF
jgi:hypothetical protein